VPRPAAPAAAGRTGRTPTKTLRRWSGRPKLITADQKVLTLLDRQTADLRQLAGVYQQWMVWLRLHRTAYLHKLLFDRAVLMGILLVLLFRSTNWAQRMPHNPSWTAGRSKHFAASTRVSRRVIAAVIILLILIACPASRGPYGIVGAD